MDERVKVGAITIIEKYVDGLCKDAGSLFGSPIERLLFEAMACHQICDYRNIPSTPGNCNSEAYWRITPQAQIGKYRVDFLIEDLPHKVRAVIECDGHQFHERTKEQARKDRSRDRDLQGEGYLVLRYTGSEIWADPMACVQDIEGQIWSFARSREKAA